LIPFLEISPICPVTAVSKEETQTVWIHGTKPETTCDPSFGTCSKGNLKDAPDLFAEELPQRRNSFKQEIELEDHQ
jgi:hypothetical protein